MKLNINPRFEKLLDPLTDEEERALRESLAEDGQLEPITVMQGDVIIDGHNRYRILSEMRTEPTIRIKRFDSEEAAEEWIIRKQLGRRNLDKLRRKELVGRLYNARKEQHGGDRKSSGQNDHLISDRENKGSAAAAHEIARETGDSEKTVRRAGKLAEALDKLPDTLAGALRKRPNVATEKAVIKLANLPETKHHEFARDLRTGATQNLDEWLGLRRKPATEKPAAKESPAEDAESPSEEVSASVVLDDLNRDVPKRLLPYHQGSLVLAEVAKAVSQAKSRAKALLVDDDVVAGAEFLDVAQVVRDLEGIRRDIMQAGYYTECPRCQGKTRKDCSRCGGNGWIPRRDKGVLSDEERAWLST